VVLFVFLVPILIGAFLLTMERLEDELLGAHPAARTTRSPATRHSRLPQRPVSQDHHAVGLCSAASGMPAAARAPGYSSS
jgi:hypothetical protein